MINNAQRVVSRSLIYGFGAFIRAAASLIMLPIYTRHLAPSDYGAIEVLNLIVDVAALVFGARITTSILKFWHQSDSDSGRGHVITTSLYLACLLNGVGVFVLIALCKPISTLMYGTDDYSSLLALFSFTLLFSAMIEIAAAYIRIMDAPWTYVSIGIAKLVLQLALNIWFVVLNDRGVWGVVYSAVISSGAVAVGLAVYLLSQNGRKWSRQLIRPMIGFTWPLIITGLGMFFITSGDRYFLRVYHGIDAVGIYALAYRFGSMTFSMVWSPFMTFWEPRQFELLQQDSRDRTVGNMFGYANVPLLAACLAISMFAPEVVSVFANEAYSQASSVVPLICLAYVFQAWTSYTRIALMHSGNTRYLATSTYYTVLLIAGLYLLLIPPFGILGAAWSTVIAMYLRWLLIYLRSQRLSPIGYPILRVHLCVAICVLAYMTSSDHAESVQEFILKCGVFLFALVPVAVALGSRESIGQILAGRRRLRSGSRG